jgi:polysaccharide deacetylase 2 family uncharacterized protein YibQ
MARKLKTINTEKLEAQKKLAEIERLELEAQQEEKNILETAAKNIENVCTLNNLFCGVILTHEDLITVLQMALKSGEQIKIPFRLYFNE